MISRQSKFILAIALQLVIIFAIIIFKVSVLTGGTDIILKIQPVDPTSPLRGDYVSFQYDISRLDSYLFNGVLIRNGDSVYVTLVQRGKYWTAQRVQKSMPSVKENQIFIKGKVASGGLTEGQLSPTGRQKYTYSVDVAYGIEEYFIPEGKGRNFSFWNKEAIAKVAVDENGNSALKQIYIDGKLWP